MPGQKSIYVWNVFVPHLLDEQNKGKGESHTKNDILLLIFKRISLKKCTDFRTEKAYFSWNELE
jgi:hypothetical protein